MVKFNKMEKNRIVTYGIVAWGTMITIVVLIMAMGSAINVPGKHKTVVIPASAKGTIYPRHPLPAHDTADIWEVLGTYYNPVMSQCDGSPLITADGSKIKIQKLKNDEVRWVALSRDLLSRWGGPFDYGDTLYVHHTNSHIRGQWLVHDSMNARFRKRIDFLRYKKGNFPGKSNNILISNKPFYNAR